MVNEELPLLPQTRDVLAQTLVKTLQGRQVARRAAFDTVYPGRR